MLVNGVRVSADPALNNEEIVTLVHDEIRLWHQRNKTLGAIELTLDGESIIIRGHEKSPIRRVRRITGYLSTVDQFNDAKRAECQDREVHAG
ncbi:anaerobic ribonucleoside-triphosphate reductase [Anaeroselena agilis]|uniref:Anaerobic ribonucleoside-triphosphate reductase n=1 Tax=Anaeroselena agilis TaxID=3063788 RepID=A0ABU3P281_9FIRM|nr:anaerobic ribonucleoside-triphosphate reductase [Selenomonadales bacterium 4137-cl]